jgi:hypothetical protein
MNAQVLIRNGWKRCKGEFRGLWAHPSYPGSRFILKVAFEQEFKRLAFKQNAKDK